MKTFVKKSIPAGNQYVSYSINMFEEHFSYIKGHVHEGWRLLLAREVLLIIFISGVTIHRHLSSNAIKFLPEGLFLDSGSELENV